MKLISWNVNGIRSVLKKGFLDFIEEHDPDILCLQETKTPAQPVSIDLPQYEQIWNHADKKGYSGVAVFTKSKPLDAENGIGMEVHDGEGRVITVEYKEFYLVNVYVPNSKRGLERLPYRCQEWDPCFLKYLKKLEKKKPVVFCGDLNVAHTEIDLANPKSNMKNHGFTKEEREGFDRIIAAGFIDTFHEFEKGEGHYTWWTQMNNCRKRNIGWRIDYFLISPSLLPKLKESIILKDVMGSDHAPVQIRLDVK